MAKSKTVKKAEPRKEEPKLEEILASLKTSIISELSPKIDSLHEKIMKEVHEEIKHIRDELPTPQIEQQAQSQQQGDKVDLGAMIEKALDNPQLQGILPNQGQPSIPQDPNGMMNPNGLMQLMQIIKMFDGPQAGMGSGSFNPALFQDIQQRNMLSMTHMQNTLFMQVMKDALKSKGMSDQDLKEFEKTQELFVGKINHMGSANEKAQAEAKKLGQQG